MREIRVTGNTVLSEDELSSITEPYLNRVLNNQDLEALRRALTLQYVNKGYVNSGAIIPDQVVENGSIRLHIIEGELTLIEVEGNKWFDDDFIKSRLALDLGTPLNILALQKRLLLLQQDDRILRLNAELRPGEGLGKSVLKVRVEERSPLVLQLAFDNYQSPSIGAERGVISLGHQNLTGHGDRMSLTLERSEGLIHLIQAQYSLPITARDTRVDLRFKQSDAEVVEEQFKPLEIESKSEDYEISIRHPLYRSFNHEFAFTLSGEHLNNETSLLGEPFSFSAGAQNGESTVSALRFSQEYTYRSQTQVVSARSRLSWGLDVLGATINQDDLVPDGRFFSWLGQFQWAKLLFPWDIQAIFRTDVQLSNDPLLPLEQIAVGGRYTVRGYRENQLVRDNGLLLSLEARVPLVRGKVWADYVHLVPFVDFGRAWDTDVSTPGPKSISSIGLGLRWAATSRTHPPQLRAQFEFFWGYALRDIETTAEHDLQDDGIHFQLVLSAS